MQKRSAKQLATAALLVAAGLILPYVTAHGFGLPGNILLPMHIPVLLCGFLCGPWYGAACGVLTPVLSSLLTGMPAAFPMLPIMVVQLLLMGLVSGLLYRSVSLNIFVALPGSIAAGLVGYAGMVQLLLFAQNPAAQQLSAITAAVRGLPGIVVQFLLLPLLVKVLERARIFPHPAKNKKDNALAQAIQLIKNGEASCVVIQHQTIVHTADGRGVSPLLNLYEKEPGLLDGAEVADKIIGKAAAVLLVLGKAKKVHGEIMSVAGQAYLQQHGIEVSFGRCVDMISNRNQTGICPIEQSVLEIDDAAEGLATIKQTLHSLAANAG